MMSVEISVCLYAAEGSSRPPAWTAMKVGQAAAGDIQRVPWVAMVGFQV